MWEVDVETFGVGHQQGDVFQWKLQIMKMITGKHK